MQAEVLKEALEHLPEAEVLKVLPETATSLRAFASLGQQDLAGYLQDWQRSRATRLKHLSFQSTPAQLEVIEEALATVMPQVGKNARDNPNPRGNALYLLRKAYLELSGREHEFSTGNSLHRLGKQPDLEDGARPQVGQGVPDAALRQ